MINNMVTMIGNLVEDPVLRFTKNETAVFNGRIAVNEPVNRNGEWMERTTYVNLVVWDNMAVNLAESVQKGDRLVVTGRLDIRAAEIGPGSRQYFTEIVAQEVGVSTRWSVVTPVRAIPDSVEQPYADVEPAF